MNRIGSAAAALAAGWLLYRRARPGDRLDGEVALVTGGSRGLGLLLARDLVRHGVSVAICARDTQELEVARADLERRGGNVLAIRCDVASADEVAGMVDVVRDHFGRIDILVNNASVIQVGPLEAMTLEDFRHAVDVNFYGTLHCTLAVLPEMRHRGRGRIANITSIGGVIAVPHLLPYSCGKFAAVGLSEGLRSELAVSGISVTTVVPGLMRTGSPVNALFKGQASREFAWFSVADGTPLTAISAERAARRIVRGIRRREATVVLSWPAHIGRLVHGVAPGFTADLLGVANRLLPASDGPSTGAVPGGRIRTRITRSPLTSLMYRAARRNNELGGVIGRGAVPGVDAGTGGRP